MKKILLAFIFFSILFISIKAYTDSGETDLYGCHISKTTGGYHCHDFSHININIDSLHKKARRGESDAQFLLGVIYYMGKSVPKDLKKSSKFFDTAKNNGYPLFNNVCGRKLDAPKKYDN